MTFDYAGLFERMYRADKAVIDAKQPQGEAICFECGATCLLDEVYSGYEQSETAPCGHVWYSYRYNGQYILE